MKRAQRVLRHVQVILDPWLAIAGALALIVGGISFWRRADSDPKPQPLAGVFNVAVVPFRAADHPTDEGSITPMTMSMAEGFAEGLKEEFDGDGRFDVDVGVRQLAVTPSSTPERIEQEAASVAAQVVVFATFRDDGENTLVEPHIYIRATGLPHVLELAGMTPLGTVISVRGSLESPSTTFLAGIRTTLRTRAAATAHLVVAALDLGFDDLDSAERELAAAGDTDDLVSERLRRLLLANIQLKRNQLDAAEQTYTSLVTEEPDFGRALLGLAEVERQRGFSECTSGRAGPHMTLSATHLSEAVVRSNEPGSLVAEKVIIGRARLSLCSGKLDVGLARALDATVAALFGSPVGEALGGDALLVRANAWSLSADHDDLERARRDFETAIFDLPFTIASRAAAEWRLGEVYTALGQTPEAISAFESALDDYDVQMKHADPQRAEAVQQDIAKIQAQLDLLRQG